MANNYRVFRFEDSSIDTLADRIEIINTMMYFSTIEKVETQAIVLHPNQNDKPKEEKFKLVPQLVVPTETIDYIKII